MGCRAIYLVAGPDSESGHSVRRLYTPGWGHPVDALGALAGACASVAAAEERDKQTDPRLAAILGPVNYAGDFFAGHVIRCATTLHGMGVRVDGDETTSLFAAHDPAAFGRQVDLEWVYLVDVETKAIWVYGAEGKMAPAHELIAAGRIDLAHAVFDVLSDAKDREAYIDDRLRRITAAGFRVNPAEDFRLLG